MVGMVIFVFVSLVLFVICLIGFRASVNVRQEYRQLHGTDKVKFFSVLHVAGLKAVEGTSCGVALSPGKITFDCNNKRYSLPVQEIRYVDSKQDINEIIYSKSSLVRGVAGAALFGVSGAVIGAAPRAKTKKKVEEYAIIGYESAEGREEVIILKDREGHVDCLSLVTTLGRYIKPQIQEVEL